jgi:CIC family chloride channel protein
MITAESLRALGSSPESQPFTVAADLMQSAVTARAEDDLRSAAQTMLDKGLRELPVVAADGKILGFLDEADVAKAYLGATQERAKRPATLA